MNYFHTTFRSAFGPFSLASDENGAVVATAFGDLSALQARAPNLHSTADKTVVATARAQLLAYLDGERMNFTVPLAARGTPFQQRVWAALRAIPFGQTRSYGELAAQLGIPGAARAVGRANATNPICVIVPCHRVIGANGSLTGFAFGEALKRRLLALEKVPAFRAA